MKFATLILFLCASAIAQPYRAVETDNSGNVVLPSNFWPQNSNAVNAVVAAGVGGGITLAQLQSATNLLAQNSTNAFYPSNNPAGFAPSNALGTAAFQASTVFLTLAATNSLVRTNDNRALLFGSSVTVNSLTNSTEAYFNQDIFMVGNLYVGAGGTVIGDASGATNLSATELRSGTVAAARMPALTGDITTSAGSVATTLKNTGTAGTYTKPTFDAQGRETSGGSLIAGDIPDIGATYLKLAATNSLVQTNDARPLVFGGIVSAAAGITGPVTNNSAAPFSGNGAGLTNLNVPLSSVTAAVRTNITAWTENFGGTLSNWEVEGDAHWTITGGKLRVEQGGGTSGRFLKYTNWITSFDSWTMTCQVTPITTGSGLGFGLLTDLGSSDRNLFMQLAFVAANPMGIFLKSGASNSLTTYGGQMSALNVAFSVNDPINVQMQRRGQLWSLAITNTSTGKYGVYTHNTCLLTAGTSGLEPQAGYFALWSVSGTQTVSNIKFTVDPIWPVKALCVGDSITTGFGADTSAETWVNLLKKDVGPGVQNFSAFGGTLTSVGLATNEINLLKPQRVLMMLGGNDVALGTSLATYSALYISTVNSISNGTTVFHCYPTPRAPTDMSPLVNFITTNYPTQLQIDTFNPLKTNDFSSYQIRPDVNYDGIHPNSLGYSVISQAIKATPGLFQTP